MQTKDFSYSLPSHLIAAYPAERRSASRLLCLNTETGRVDHRQFADLPGCLRRNDLLVFNDTRVIPARLLGRKATGGRVELLVERIRPDQQVVTQLRASKPPAAGSRLLLGGEDGTVPVEAEVMGREGEFYVVRFPDGRPVLDILAQSGHMPLPPYIRRKDKPLDQERYQTVYGRVPGAVAAPTAGLHFDTELLNRIAASGIETARVTLHVGAGTFQPVRVEDFRQHRMHAEHASVSAATCQAIAACRERGGRVIAVGTTTVRSLESAARSGHLIPFEGDTDIFIYPGFEFRVVDAMITNFHLPESTLLMLVSAFAGREMILGAYEKAIKEGYRFFSYGDAMLLYRDPDPAR
ncbi:MAG: hypothetical protein RLZZ385_1757 [Pseudomonadota bacterium]|jgi:S-adenosylmethionine:tRNA ribosyltransferase-isomerase